MNWLNSVYPFQNELARQYSQTLYQGHFRHLPARTERQEQTLQPQGTEQERQIQALREQFPLAQESGSEHTTITI